MSSDPSDPAPSDPSSPEPTKLPVPRRRVRHNEWTRAKMVGFLRELAACQNVGQAAQAVGMSRQSAYRLRNRLERTPFALGWEVALECGMQQLAHAVMDRALNGVEEQRFYHGELIGTVRKFDNRLAQWVLENPWQVGRSQVAREWSARRFDALLERIEHEGLDWDAQETAPDAEPLLAVPETEATRRARFLDRESWYAADARYDADKGRSQSGGAKRA